MKQDREHGGKWATVVHFSLFALRGSGDGQPGQLQVLSMEDLAPGLKPLLMWMANAIELLHFIQHHVPQLLLFRRDQQDPGGPRRYAAATPTAGCFNLCVCVCVCSQVC